MSLEEIVDNSRTDKNTAHSYLQLYQQLLVSKKESARNVLEVGICDGGSIKLWSDFFTNATVYGLDIMNIKNVWNEIKNKHNIVLHTSTDAYDKTFFTNNFLSKNLKFDFMLDDGPHSLESMKEFIKLYSQIMTDDGILIIEDVQSWHWIDILKNEVPNHLKKFIKVYDLRPHKNRYDDIVFTIDKLLLNTDINNKFTNINVCTIDMFKNVNDIIPINIVYYTYINPNVNYKEIIRGQLTDVINSKVNAKLFIVISCENKKLIPEIKSLIYDTMDNTPIIYNLDIENENIFEYYGIKKIFDLASIEPHKHYLYIHGKGMFNQHGDSNIRVKSNVFLTQTHVNPWNKVLEIFKTDENINIISMFPSESFGWFNFWWATGKYLSTCEEPKMSRENRYYYEGWLSSGKINNNKIYNLLEHNYKSYTADQASKLITECLLK